ncbi:type I toxin-antitoxin system Fst family toxin [Macrococcoides caseolyticum]|uniref:Type I toxin-antitoxin system Fst family toxin n=3 Tax=Macrococcus TaxID=69965 RepID=A0A4R6BHG9_9STAP|nr:MULTISPECIES: type I toxin-antitoxin system Fst family toxin [Staphylococcaceae]HEE9186273.1 type I toxin-antitoxin system Fst family toxin [Staphylococcus aureus]MBQ5153651.1 type I toxin-antitoxin system Fst family toxin [Macrococcus caseolyticus]MDJ1156550.1 type I toxin-antitoxin system Fst family toxin [Macrococcus caseolyticus]QYA77710.1 type I toxin-antitoxin system Fst family toxin [Macrococcus caseolyticus]RKO13293.1 type I toxin-antitoxin system Fst family toxin [Macrococcus caseo
MDYILVNIVAPIIVGVVLALFSHWLDQRKS